MRQPAGDVENTVAIKTGKAGPLGLSGRIEGLKWTHIKSKSDAVARYQQWADADPTREVGLVYNHDTRAYEVVQGQSFVVKGEFLTGNKTLLKHYHHGADFAARLPSAADFAFLTRRNGTSRPWVSDVTYINEMGEYHDTVFGFHPGDAGRPPSYWVKFVDTDKRTKFQVFTDSPWGEGSSFKQWKQQYIKVVPLRPSTPAKPAGAPSAEGMKMSADADDQAIKQASAQSATKASTPKGKSAAAKAGTTPSAQTSAPKPPARRETVEEFLARGGKVTKVDPQPTPEPGITAAPTHKSDERSILGEGPEVASIQDADRRRAGMAAKPKHHVFPQERRTWFEERGFTGKRDIDNFTLELDEAGHQAIHGGGDYRLGRTWANEWNARVWRELQAAETQAGRRLRYREIRAIIVRLMDEYGIKKKFVKY